MRVSASPIACLICCLLVGGAAQAQQADASSDVGLRRVASERPQDKGLQESTSKRAETHGKVHGKRSASVRPPFHHEELPCPRATWKYDPVCADAPDEHTLPTPSTRGAASQQRDGTPKVQAPGAENLSVGVDWQANNNPRLPGYDSVPMIDSVKKNIPDATVSSPGQRLGLGLDLKF
jgi:hypothetical protein